MSGSVPSHPGTVIVRAAEAGAWQEGYLVLERARAEAQALHADAEKTLLASRAEGLEVGRRVGEAQAAELLLQARMDVDRYLAGVEPQLADLAITVVRKLLGSFDDAALIAALVRESLGALRRETQLTIRVAPHLAAQLEEILSREAGGRPPILSIEADPRIENGRCIVVSPTTTLEIGFDAQLDALRAALAPPAT